MTKLFIADSDDLEYCSASCDSDLLSMIPGNTSIQNSGNATMSHDEDSMERRRATTYGSVNPYMPKEIRSASCCVAGDHMLTSSCREFLKRSLSLTSMVHVDISDIHGEGEAPNVPLSLRRCKKMILTPYTVLLSLIGWRPWFKDSVPRCYPFWKIINFIYPTIVILLMLYHYAFQILTCQGKYNIYKDTQPLPTVQPTVRPSDDIKIDANCSILDMVFGKCTKRIPHKDVEEQDYNCQHILPTYIVPMIMYLLAFTYGFLYFRIQESEQLYSLMERVFLQAYATPGVQGILIRNSRLYLVGALAWLLVQFGTELLYYNTYRMELHINGDVVSLTDTERYICICMKFLGMMLVQCVNVAVVLNYCIQCEMLVFHVKGICLRLHEKTIEIKDAMHEILGIRAFISLLNESMGKMTAFCVVNFAELTIVGVALLLLNRIHEERIITYRAVFPALWLAAMLLPLLQAARLTKVGSKLRQISFEMRVFGYQRASQLDLDSFVLFVSGATLRAKLFGITIRPASIILTFGAAVFVVSTLMIVDLVTVSGYKTI